MQDQIEVLKFEETPESKHIGVAHIRLFKQVVLRYKVIENKDGSGFFIVPPSYKREFDGQEKWNQWFMLDSQVFSEEVQDAIRLYVTRLFSQKTAYKAPDGQTTAQATQSYQAPQNNAPAPDVRYQSGLSAASYQNQNQYAEASRGDDSVPF
jgi:hypothetical protein